MKPAEHRETDTMLPAILTVVEPGSVVHSDEWKVRRTMATSRVRISNRTVQHLVSFVERSTVVVVHTQHVDFY